jgi:hypothetical protein
MPERPGFQKRQYDFAAHIRDPDAHAAPKGIEDRRMAIYRDLFFNNVSGLLAKTFPVLNKILGEDAWRSLMRDFFARHESHTPLFLEVPREFLKYLETERGVVGGDLPFMLELAHYEWVELALSIDERDADLSNVDAGGDLLAGSPVLSPLFRSLIYKYPVHQLSPSFQPSEPPQEPTRLLVYRDLNDKVGFLEINAVTARLLELFAEEDRMTGRQALETIAQELDHPQPETVVNGGLEIMERLRKCHVVLGVRNSS